MLGFRVSAFDMVFCLSKAIDLVDASLVDHHYRVAYVAYRLASELDLPAQQRNDILIAAALHDVGALSTSERLKALTFDEEQDLLDRHAFQGALLITDFSLFAGVASLIRNHHCRWDRNKDGVPLGSHIIHLADRVAILLRREVAPLKQVRGILEQIQSEAGYMFSPQLVEAFKGLATRESFWLDMVSPDLDDILRDQAVLGIFEMGIGQVLDLSLLFSKIIDFRSRFTNTHSQGVAAAAETIMEIFGFSANEVLLMKAAGYLHDLGKLAVPSSILEKPSGLTEDEIALVRAHTYYTYRILNAVEALRSMAEWASFHHERIDGNGYPFHLRGDDLSLGSRIMAVADVFTAIAENRPYRQALSASKVMGILQRMVAEGALDRNVVAAVGDNYNNLDSRRVLAQQTAAWDYEELLEDGKRFDSGRSNLVSIRC